MIHRSIRIGLWQVDFLFAPDGYDEEEVLTFLYDMDAPRSVSLRAYRIMEGRFKNRGFTYSSNMHRKVLVVVGPTTSSKQFLNTLTHEVRHVADAIAKSVGHDLDSEAPAYMTGDAVMALAEVVCRLGCPSCHK